MPIKTQRGYYLACCEGHFLWRTLAQTERRASELMATDIKRLDPFQLSQQQWDRRYEDSVAQYG